MCKFERNLEYYKKEHPKLKASSPIIYWELDQGFDKTYLPNMETDITLEGEKSILIIDTKYYSKNMVDIHGSDKVYSSNLYQIFSYVKNKQLKVIDKKVSGMLLYAQTTAPKQPFAIYSMSGNIIAVRALDLSCDFKLVKQQLDKLVEDFLT